MGDMADFALSTIDFAPEYPENEPPITRSCKYCKQGVLYWMEISPNQFRLCNINREIHSCTAYKKED